MKQFIVGLTLGLLFFIAHSTFAQKAAYLDGLIITHEHDTLIGRIKPRNVVRSCKGVNFLTEDGVKKTFSPEDVIAYYVSGTYYESHKLSKGRLNKPVFLQLKVEGAVNLYVYYTNNYLAGGNNYLAGDNNFYLPSDNTVIATLYLKRENSDELVKIKGSFRKVLSDFFSDDQVLAKEVKKQTFRYEDISYLVVFYNKSH